VKVLLPISHFTSKATPRIIFEKAALFFVQFLLLRSPSAIAYLSSIPPFVLGTIRYWFASILSAVPAFMLPPLLRDRTKLFQPFCSRQIDLSLDLSTLLEKPTSGRVQESQSELSPPRPAFEVSFTKTPLEGLLLPVFMIPSSPPSFFGCRQVPPAVRRRLDPFLFDKIVLLILFDNYDRPLSLPLVQSFVFSVGFSWPVLVTSFP